ncbi:TetR/AcrR family transcriptional regulator [Cellulomonas sp. P24]|nr:TetR/AcrR family transcriptional regulator [Cellulomonas sp. P24]
MTLADIAAAAGVGRTAVYNHFPDKESLLLGFITHETNLYVATIDAAINEVSDPTDQLRTYVRQQIDLRRVYQLAPGPDLRSVLSRGTRQRMRDHVTAVEKILRRVLAAGIEAGAFPEQDLDTTVPLVNACLSGRGSPARDPSGRRRSSRPRPSCCAPSVRTSTPARGVHARTPNSSPPEGAALASARYRRSARARSVRSPASITNPPSSTTVPPTLPSSASTARVIDGATRLRAIACSGSDTSSSPASTPGGDQATRYPYTPNADGSAVARTSGSSVDRARLTRTRPSYS